MIIPSPMLLKDLQVTHADYDPAFLSSIADFYEGGARFEANKGAYLRARGGDSVKTWRASRLACAYYTPHLSGKVDGLVGGILRNIPKITTASPDDPRSDYWLALNHDVDGCGRDLAAVTRQALLAEMLPARAYLCVCTPEMEAIEGETVEDAKTRGRLDCTIKSIDASQVDDWNIDDDGINWIRTHCVETERAGGIGPAVLEVHTWRYYERDQVTVYTAEREIKKGKPVAWPENYIARCVQNPHGLGIIPIIPVETPDGFNLGGRLLPIAKALFCREAALCYHLDNAAYAVPVVNTDKPIDQVFLNELNMLNPGLNGRVSIVEFSGVTAASLTADCAKLKNDLDSAMQALADQARDRTSGVAQQQFREPKEVLMSLFAMPMVDALEKALKAIAAYRGEESLGVKLTGLDEFDTQSTEVVIASMTQFLAMPEMPATARRLAYEIVIESALHVKNPDDAAAIAEELGEINGPPPQIAKAGFGGDSAKPGESLNTKTGAPQGMGADQVRQSLQLPHGHAMPIEHLAESIRE